MRKLDFPNVGISMRDGGFFFDKDHEFLGKPGQGRGVAKLCIENPLWCCDDIGGAIFKYPLIKKLFRLSLDVIKYNLMRSNSFVLLIVPEADKLKTEESDV